MKAKFLFLSAMVALAGLAIGCKPENITGNDIQGLSVESSYLQMAPAGGSVTLKFTASEDWKLFEETSYTWKDADKKSHTVDTLIAPDGVGAKPHGVAVTSWLTADKVSGGAGEYSVTLTAPKSDNYITRQLRLVSGDNAQYVTVSQNESVVSLASCKEIIDGPDGKVFMVKGVCTEIANTQYGNWYLDDGTGQIYIYGTVDATGAYNWASFNIAVGDEVTVQGPKTTYGGVVELVDVKVLKVKKSLLAIEQTEFSVGSSASTITVKALPKGDSFNFKSNADWLAISSTEEVGDTTMVNIFVAENNSPEARSGEIEFSSASGSTVSSLVVKVVQAGLKGQTADNPYTVAEAIAAIDAGTAGTTPVFVKGIISQIDNIDTKYGNAQYWISDDGSTDGQMEIYRGLKFDSAKFVEGDVLGKGWNVVVCGVLTKYGNTYEFKANNFLHSIEGATAAMTASEAIAYIDSPEFDSTKKVIVSGVINTVTISVSYGNAEVWVSDDGSTKEFEFFRNLYFKGAKYTAEDQLKVGDKVSAVGTLTKYKTTYEFAANNYILTLNGLTE